MKTQDELYQKVRLTPRVPRVVLNRTRNMGNKIDKTKTQDHLGNHRAIRKVMGKLVKGAVDCGISGVPLSAVEQQDTTRENKVKKLIEKFENHKHNESVLQDLSQTQKINKFSNESQDLIADLNNTEIFELCENSSKQQCPDSNAFWEMVVIYCSCGRNMKSTRSPTEFDQNNRNVTSIPGSVIKNISRGAKHGPGETDAEKGTSTPTKNTESHCQP